MVSSKGKVSVSSQCEMQLCIGSLTTKWGKKWASKWEVILPPRRGHTWIGNAYPTSSGIVHKGDDGH